VRYICKVTKSGDQKRITLPKAFLSQNKLEGAEYVVIDDIDRPNIQLRGWDGRIKNKAEGG